MGVDLCSVRHYRGENRLGQSVTAVLEGDPSGQPTGEVYDEGFRCTFVGIHQLGDLANQTRTGQTQLLELVHQRPGVEEFKRRMLDILAPE